MLNRKRLSRRQFLQLTSAAGASALLAACGGATPPATPADTAAPAAAPPTAAPAAAPTAAPAPPAAPTAAPAAAAPTAAPAAAQSLADLLGADMPGSPTHARGWTTMLPDLPAGLPPTGEPVTISVTRRVDAQTKFAQGDSLENNPWSRMIEKLFGVKFAVAWTWATDDEANSKYNLALSSGDMPEYLETVPLNVFVQMVQAGALEDITDAWEKYASDRWKKALEPYGELPWTWSKVDGRIYGLPRVEDLAHNDTILWYRADWLDKLNLKPPTTLDELHDVALAIVKAGIGKGASGTTLGLMSNKQYNHTWYGSLDPIWGAYGVIPDHWSKVGDGLMLDAVRPEMKEPLALLNQWYKDGIFRKDFFTVETSDSVQDVASSQVGLHFTPSWGANLDAVKNDPDTKWAFTGIPTGPNGTKGKHTENNFREQSFAFRKGAQNIEKIFQITNWMIDLTEDFSRRFHGWEVYNYEWKDDKVAWTDIGWSPWAIGPIGTRGGGMADPKRVGNEIKYRRDEWSKIPAEQRDAMQNLLLEDPTGVQQVSDESRLFILDTASDGKMTELQRLPTPTQLERGADLQKVIDETLIGIIVGEKPMSAFDEMVTQWKQLGGDQVTQEVNEWYASKKA
jgi:putative aldouronate transport system substrate-binding protein